MPRNPESKSKPYVLIPMPSERPKVDFVVTHEKFAGLTGRLELNFEVVSEYLFVGSGAYEFDPNARGNRPDVWHTFYRRNGQICVPGTSIKGAIRAIVEAISNSCVSQFRRGKEKLGLKEHRPCRFENEKSQLCPACRLFGTTGFRGRVHFSDFLPQPEAKLEIVKIGELWEPRRYDPTKRRFYERKSFQPVGDLRLKSGFRFVEAVPKGAKFRGTLNFENLSKAELGLIFYALGWTVDADQVKIAFAPKIGGAKPRCFGSVKFRPVRLLLWNGDLKGLLTPQEMVGNELLSFLSSCLQECQESDLLHKDSWEALVQGFMPKNEPCPQGLY